MGYLIESDQSVAGYRRETKITVVVAAATANVALSTLVNGVSIDGITCNTGDLVLAPCQTTGSENGVYEIQGSTTGLRAVDWDSATMLWPGRMVYVERGTKHGRSIWSIANNYGTVGLLPDNTTIYWRKLNANGPRHDWLMPSGAITRTYDEGPASNANTAAALTSGTIMSWAIPVYAGVALSSATFVSGSTAADTPTNQWAGLCDQSRVVKAISADATTAAWAADTAKTFTFGATWTPNEDGVARVFLMVAASVAVPSLMGIADGRDTLNALGHLRARSHDTGQTTPPALAVTLAAGSAKQQKVWAYVS